MAKVIIKMEDLDNGNVKVTTDPKAQDLLSRRLSPEGITGAVCYAAQALNAIRESAKKFNQTENITNDENMTY